VHGRILAAFAAGLLTAVAAPAVSAAPCSAGELRITTMTPSAAVRNHGNGTLRVYIWYPTHGVEHEVDIGPADRPLFITGQLAANAPFADAARHPVILLSHGFGGVARQLTWLGAPLARHGYVVVAVDHPGTNGRDGITDEGAYAPWERAGDLSAALDLALASRNLARHVDPHHVGVAGFSMGGFAALLLAGARADFEQLARFCAGPERDAICKPQEEYPLDVTHAPAVLAEPGMHDIAAREGKVWRDRRIGAAFVIAPALVQALDAASLRKIHIPLEVVLGAADPIAPPATNGELAAQLVPGARIEVLPGVGHYDFLSECGPGGLQSGGVYCTDGAGTSRAGTHAFTVARAITFFDDRIGRAGRGACTS
jgi:predicted dienelactone hydrolase